MSASTLSFLLCGLRPGSCTKPACRYLPALSLTVLLCFLLMFLLCLSLLRVSSVAIFYRSAASDQRAFSLSLSRIQPTRGAHLPVWRSFALWRRRGLGQVFRRVGDSPCDEMQAVEANP